MAKTPVSVLQEYCAKHMIVPQYDLVVNGVGTHNPFFKYRLTVNDVVTHGEGKSKKEAKHEAARYAVRELLPNSKEVQQLRPGNDSNTMSGNEDFFSPYQNVIKQNTIGELATVCGNKLLPVPEYVLVGEVGQPHAKTFTYECNVANIKEYASSRTKQQAKHLSAIKMLERLKSVFGPSIVQVDTEAHEMEEKKFGEITKMAIGEFRKWKCRNRPQKYSSSLFHYHNLNLRVMLYPHPVISALEAYDEDMSKNSVDASELLITLAKEARKNINFFFIRYRKKHRRSVCSCNFDIGENFVTLGMSLSNEEALRIAAHKMVIHLQTYL